MRNPKGLRLYKVVTPTRVLYFDNMREAKNIRDDLMNSGWGNHRKTDNLVVNRGPDHRRGETGVAA